MGEPTDWCALRNSGRSKQVRNLSRGSANRIPRETLLASLDSNGLRVERKYLRESRGERSLDGGIVGHGASGRGVESSEHGLWKTVCSITVSLQYNRQLVSYGIDSLTKTPKNSRALQSKN